MNLKEVIAELLKTPEVVGMQEIETPPVVNTDNGGSVPPADGAGTTETDYEAENKQLRLQIEELQKSNKALLDKTSVSDTEQIDPILAICGISIGGNKENG